MLLNYQQFPSPNSRGRIPLLIIPGLFGSISNWRRMAKSLSEYAPVYVIEQRNHGQSPQAETQNWDDMVGDLSDTLKHLTLEHVHLIGHSMGGKVAMLYALQDQHRLASLSVLDIAPAQYQHSPAPFLKSLLSIDLSPIQSRSEADRALTQAIPDTVTRLFLLQNLSGRPGRYHWRINVPVLYHYMPEMIGFPDCEGSVDLKTLVLRGENSNYVLAEHQPLFTKLFPQVKTITVEQAGHWLHVEQPQRVISELLKFIQYD